MFDQSENVKTIFHTLFFIKTSTFNLTKDYVVTYRILKTFALVPILTQDQILKKSSETNF